MDRIELEQALDRNARRFLAAVKYYGGEATTSEIRARTGLSRSIVNHRFGRLDDLDLIDITRAEHGHGDREPPKIAHLTGAARREIERGILRNIDANGTPEEIRDLEAEVRTLHEENDELRERLNALEDLARGDRERLDDLEHDVDYLYEWGEEAEEAIKTLWSERE